MIAGGGLLVLLLLVLFLATRPRQGAPRLPSPTTAVRVVDTESERQRRAHYEALDAELDRRLEEKRRIPPPESPPTT